MHINRKPRVYVGVDDTPGSLRALRRAADEARRRDAELYVVHVVRPVRASVSRTNILDPSTAASSARAIPSIDDEAEHVIATCLDQAFGGTPADLTVKYLAIIGRPAKRLSNLSRSDDDLVVVGASKHQRWRYLMRRSVSKYCATHAACPVLVVPPDRFATAMMRDSRRLRWAPLRHNLWKQFDAVAGDNQQLIP